MQIIGTCLNPEPDKLSCTLNFIPKARSPRLRRFFWIGDLKLVRRKISPAVAFLTVRAGKGFVVSLMYVGICWVFDSWSGTSVSAYRKNMLMQTEPVASDAAVCSAKRCVVQPVKKRRSLFSILCCVCKSTVVHPRILRCRGI